MVTLRRPLPLPLPLALASLVACVAPVSCAGGDETSAQAGDELIGGEAATEKALDAVGILQTESSHHPFCTGTLIAPRLVLSALHCRWYLAQARADEGITFGIDRYEGRERTRTTYRVARTLTTGRRGAGALGLGRDAMLMILEKPVPADVATPIPVRARPLDASDVGKKLLTVGYGEGSRGERMKGQNTLDAVDGRPYERAFGSEEAFRAWVAKNVGETEAANFDYRNSVLSAEADEVHVGLGRGGLAPGDAQTCQGDSGGPLLERVNGGYVLTGLTTAGERGCVLGSIRTRLGPETQDAIAKSLAADPPFAWACLADGSARDRCEGSTRVTCDDDGSVHVERCDALGADFACVEGEAPAARCQRPDGQGAPPALSNDPAAIQRVLFADAQTCLLRASGEVTCASTHFDGPRRLEVKEKVIATDAVKLGLLSGAGASALLRDGSVIGWGNGRRDARSDHWATSPSLVAKGPYRDMMGRCLVRADGVVECFNGITAFNGIGELEPVALPAGVTRIATNYDHACAISRGEVWCWGNNNEGELGVARPGPGEPIWRDEPVRVPGIADAVDVGLGFNYSCAVRATGRVTCWGAAPNDPTGDRSAPFDLSLVGDAVAIAAYSDDAACILRRGGLVSCFGRMGYHAAPWSSREAWSSVEITELSGVSRVDVALQDGACAITDAGHGLSCWGTLEVLPPGVGASGAFSRIAPVQLVQRTAP